MHNRQITAAAAVLLIAATGLAGDVPSAANILHAKLSPAAWGARYVKAILPDGRPKLNLQVPETLVFNAAGKQVGYRRGYGSNADSWLATVLKQEPSPKAAALSDFVKDLVTPDGNKFPPVFGHDQPVVVVFGAVWCAPCRALKADLEKIPGITILDLDVDAAKMNLKEVMATVKKKSSD